MVKRIFAIIGIVFGSVTAFVGAVVGVMAAMGKFKTPIVYPTVLNFAVSEEVVIEETPYSEGAPQTATLHSFMLVGSNPDEKEHEVNQRDCYVWFNDGESAKLITLCDKYRNPLTPDRNNRYLVKCNEPIYYMINKLEGDATTDGKVTLVARSTNETLKKPENPMTIWIDRKVESVFVDYGTNKDENNKTQNITVGVDIGFDFNYLVNTPLSLKPISKESEKEIELFYNVEGQGYGDDYVKVTEDEVKNTNSPLNSILTYKNGVFKFEAHSATPKTHKFYIGVFETYQAKIDYLNFIDGQNIVNPNHHRTTYMNLTTLTINVEDIEISEAGFNGNNVVLNLYSEKDYITLNGTSGVEGAKDNNLQLYMKKGIDGSQVEDLTRFDEVNMNGFAGDVWSDKTPKFSATTAANATVEWPGEILPTSVVWSKVSLSDTLKVVNYLQTENGQERYYCSNGVAVYDTTSNKFKLLKAGSYLNFYVQTTANSETTFKVADFNHVQTAHGSGENKSWNIVSKEIPELINNAQTTENLCLGILVVNSKGEFILENFFDTIPVTVNEVDLDYTVLKENAEMEITFVESTQDDDGIRYSYEDFDKFIRINNGSYNACAFFVEQKLDTDGVTDITMVDTISNIKYKVGTKTYVLVGYVDNNGNFVNTVRVNKNVNKANSSCEIVMMQFKNAHEQSIYSFLQPMLTAIKNVPTTEFIYNSESEEIVQLHTRNAISISAKYVLNGELLSYEFYDKYVGKDSNENVLTEKDESGIREVYENTINHTIIINSKNASMWEKIKEFYALTGNSFDVNYDYNLIIDNDITIGNDGELKLTYDVEKCLSDENIVVTIDLNDVGSNFSLGGVKILSGSPDYIVLNAGEGQSVQLDDSTEQALASLNYLEVEVQYNTGSKELTYVLKLVKESGSYTIGTYPTDLQTKNIFNEEISGSTALGFQDREDKGQTLPVDYDVLDNKIFNTDNLETMTELVSKGGTTILLVKIGDTTKYLKVVANTSSFDVLTVGNTTSGDKKTTTVALSELVELKYDTDTLKLTQSNAVNISNVRVVSYGDGTLQVFHNEKTNVWTLKKSETDPAILTIRDDATKGWLFEKTNAYITLTISFEVETFADYNQSTNEHDNLQYRLTFASSVAISVTDTWKDNRVFYVGTEVMLTGTDYSVFNITKETGVQGTISFSVNDLQTGLSGDKFTPQKEHIGNITIQVLFNVVEIAEFMFEVKPNVVATLKENLDLKSETSYNINALYTLNSYDTSITYGADENSTYANNIVEMDDDVISVLSIMVDSEGNTDNLVVGGNQLSTNSMVELGVEKERKIYLVYKYQLGIVDYYYYVSTDIIKITNVHAFSDEDTDENEATVRTYKALKEYTSFVNVAGFKLESITADNLKFVVDSANNTFKITTLLTQELKDVVLKLTFNNKESEEDTEYQTLTYETKINLIPYIPQTLSVFETAYSGAKYDLFNRIYNANEIVADENISKLFVTGLFDDKGNDISSTVAKNFVAGGYLQGIDSPICEVNFNEIVGETKLINVQFTITYADGKTTFTYEVPLTIKNRQEIISQYPEENISLTNGVFKFFDDYHKDALECGATSVANDGTCQISEFSFEPVAVYSDSSVVLDFGFDGAKKVSRAYVNPVAPTEILNADANKSENLTIKLIGYQNNPGMGEYVSNKVNVNYNTNQISLGSAQQRMFGTLVFRLESVSGSYKHYLVYIYSVGTKVHSNVNATNNLDVVLSTTNVSNMFTSSYPTISTTETSMKFTELVTAVSELTVLSENLFEKTFKKSYTNTELYLYEGTTTDGVFDYDLVSGDTDSRRWTKLTGNDAITLGDKFQVITIGLVNNVNEQIYAYGTITIYVQPTKDVDDTIGGSIGAEIVENSWKFNAPNGYFEAEIIPSATKIDCPFGTGWLATIDGVYEGGTKLDTHSFSASGSHVSFNNKKVATDTLIKVKYTNGNTTIFVDYTFLATEIPTATTVTVGGPKFDEQNFIGFDNVIDLMSSANKEKFFKTYVGGYTIKIDGKVLASENGSLDLDNDTKPDITRSGSELTFVQSTSEKEIQIEIIYDNLEGENKSTTFTFNVKAGVYLDDRSTNSNSGLSNSSRRTTAGNGYTNNIGSTLSVSRPTVTGYYEVDVADLKIYTVTEATLNLSFGENSDYVVGTLNNGILTLAGDAINFVHSAVTKPITMNVSVRDGSNEYVSRNLYLNVAQTYKTLKAKYLTTGATHENVESYKMNGQTKVASEINNLHTNLFANKYSLLKPDGSVQPADLTALGFTTVGNPNYIEFEVTGNATLREFGTSPKTKGIVFNEVTTPTMCPLYLSNKAGMFKNEDNTYNFQIMPGNQVDGLNFSSTNGYNASSEGYITFTMKDKATNYYNSEHLAEDKDRPFVLGTMLDVKNNSVFTIDNFKINGTGNPSSQNTLIIEEGKYSGNATSVVGGYINGIQHKITYSNYEFYITLDTETSFVELIVKRTGGTAQNITLTISLGGVNGETKILNNFTLFLTKDEIVEKHNSVTDTSVYAGHLIKLFENTDTDGLIDDGKFIENGGVTLPTLTYLMTDSSYVLAGKEYKLSAADYDNELFKYDSAKREIQTKPVGENISATINFVVQSGNYVIKTVTYKVYINLNLQIVVNGEKLIENIGNTSPETYFALTNNGANFSLTKNFTQTVTDLNKDNDYYNVLAFNLYNINKQGNENATDEELKADSNAVEISLHSAPSDCFVVSQTGIEFKKDFTGDIELKLAVKTDNGTYYVIWTIYVKGLLTLENVNIDEDYSRIENNEMPFNSGREVDIIRTDLENGVGIKMTTASNFSVANQYKSASASAVTEGQSLYGYYESDGTTTSLITEKSRVYNSAEDSGKTYFKGRMVHYDYAINILNNTTKAMTNKELFNNTNEYKLGTGEGDGAITANAFTIELPNVPSTTIHQQQSYFVTYKIYVEYLGLEYNDNSASNEVQVFYITYNVINYQNINVYQYNNGTADVWSGNVIVESRVDKTSVSGKYYLDLLYFEDKYTYGTDTYKMFYSGDEIKLMFNDGTNTTEYIYNESLDNNNERVFVNDNDEEDRIYFDINARTIMHNADTKSGGTWSTKQNNDVTYYSVLQGDFDNVFEFKKFVDLYLGAKVTNTKGVLIGDKLFSLSEIKDGRYGVNLNENGKLFDNELPASLTLITGGVKTLTISAYSETNTSGFGLFTSNAITPVDSKKLSTMFLASYFSSNKGLLISESIIGIGSTPSDDWVENGTVDGSFEDNETYATITIPGTGSYAVKKVQYKSNTDSSDPYYSTTKQYYYIAADEVVVPDYDSVGIGGYYFKVKYGSSLELSNAVKVWKTNTTSHKLEKVPFEGAISATITDIAGVTSPTYDETNKKVIITKDVLDSYKRTHPNKKVYPTFNVNITAGGVTLTCGVEFNLYDYIQMNKLSKNGNAITQNGTNNIEIDLKEQISVATNGGYSLLTSSNLTSVKSVVENGYNGYKLDYVDGKLTLNGNLINKYFTDYSSATELKVLFTVETEYGAVEFEIAVKKST